MRWSAFAVRLENEIRGLLKTFGVMFGKRVGGFMRRAEEIIAEELARRTRAAADLRGAGCGAARRP